MISFVDVVDNEALAGLVTGQNYTLFRSLKNSEEANVTEDII